MEKSFQGKGAPHHMGVFMENRGSPKGKRNTQRSFVGRLPKNLGLSRHVVDSSTLGQLLLQGPFFKGIVIQVKDL